METRAFTPRLENEMAFPILDDVPGQEHVVEFCPARLSRRSGRLFTGVKMKPLNHTTNKEQSEYMKMRLAQNKFRGMTKAEQWAENALSLTCRKWTWQSTRGYRIYDFWSDKIGCAVEVDGPEHNKAVDEYRDEYNFRRSGIVVLRVRNYNEADLEKALSHIADLTDWKVRRAQLGIEGGRKDKRRLSSLPYFVHNRLLPAFLDNKSLGLEDLRKLLI
jgi:very-short-patch-repair endonuclease